MERTSRKDYAKFAKTIPDYTIRDRIEGSYGAQVRVGEAGYAIPTSLFENTHDAGFGCFPVDIRLIAGDRFRPHSFRAMGELRVQ